MQYLRQSTAATVKMGPFLDDSDGKTAETGLTIAQADIRLSKNGGAFAQTNNSAGATHDENGWYGVPLDTTDTGTLGRLTVNISESGALPVWENFTVVTANVYDTLCSTDSFDVNVTAISGDSTAADNLEAAADGTGYNLGGGDIVAASVTAGVTASTVSDKTGYALTAAYDAAKNAAPESGGNIAAILADTDELQTNQGNWTTATGFATASDITTAHSTTDGKIDAVAADTTLIEKWILDKLVGTDNGDGTVTYVLYDTDGTTPLKTWVLTTATGTRAAAS